MLTLGQISASKKSKHGFEKLVEWGIGRDFTEEVEFWTQVKYG